MIYGRRPTREFALFNMAICSDMMKQTFVSEFSRLSSAQPSIANTLLQHPSEFFLCQIHVNHSRYAQEAAYKSTDQYNGQQCGKCVYNGAGCCNTGSRLRPLPSFSNDNFESLELQMQMEDTVDNHSDGALNFAAVKGKYACPHCLYMVTEGRSGNAPTIDIASLHDVIDRWLVRCIIFALDKGSDIFYLPLPARMT